MLLYKLWAYIKRDFAIQTSYRINFVLNVVNIFFRVCGYYFLAKFIGKAVAPSLVAYGGDYFPFVLIGIAMANYSAVVSEACASSLREAQQTGTLEATLSTPTSLLSNVLLAGAYSILYTVIEIIIYFLIAILIFNQAFPNVNILGLTLTLIISTAAFFSLGLFSVAFVLWLKRGNPINWVLNSVSWLLAGTLYPVAILPNWLQQTSIVLPLTHSLQAVRLTLLNGASLGEISLNLWALAIFSIISLPLAVAFLYYAYRKAREQGTLLQY